LWCHEQQKRARKGIALREFLPPVALELQWLAQYAPVQSNHAGAIPKMSAPTARRFKTLVYDGPSRTGKSERALSWFTEEKTLKLKCQNVLSPNLHEFLTGKYSAILCEECTWQLLWNNKQLFQAAPCVVQLGQSQCNEHCYSVWCWGVPFMVCSSNFWKDSADKVARDWVAEKYILCEMGFTDVAALKLCSTMMQMRRDQIHMRRCPVDRTDLGVTHVAAGLCD